MSSDLIRTIKKLVLEAGIPNFGGKLGAAVKSNPPPQGGAVFGGGSGPTAGSGAPWGTTAHNIYRGATGQLGSQQTTQSHLQRPAPQSQSLAPINRMERPLNTARNTATPSGGGISNNAGRDNNSPFTKMANNIDSTYRSAKRAVGLTDVRTQNSSVPTQQKVAAPAFAPRGSPIASAQAAPAPKPQPSVAPKPSTPSLGNSMAAAARGVESKGRAAQALRSTAPAVVANAQKQKVAATAQKPIAPKPSTSMPKPKSTVKPVTKKPISSKPIKKTGKWGFGSGSGSQDAGSITNRALGAVNETTKLIETIKTLTKKKNCKGESPKGTPDEVIINPESGLLPPSR